MKQIIKIVIALAITLSLSLQASAQSQRQITFVNKYRLYADIVEYLYDIPTEITLGVAMLESYYGESKAAKEKNNFHGILNGGKSFESPYDAFMYFGKLLSGNTGNDYLTKRYAPLKKCKHWREIAVMLGTPVDEGGVGYAVNNSFYSGKLIRVILYNKELIQ